jgi:hypothetical protein
LPNPMFIIELEQPLAQKTFFLYTQILNTYPPIL